MFNDDFVAIGNPTSFNPESLSVRLVVCDDKSCRMAEDLDFDEALTVWAAMSEDPQNWEELCGFWARYRTPVVCERLEWLPFQPTTFEKALAELSELGGWIVFDLRSKRVVTGKGVQNIGHRAILALGQQGQNSRVFPLPICLPPWWEVCSDAESAAINRDREIPLNPPRTSRNFLYGEPLFHEVAVHILNLAQQGVIPAPHQRKVDFLSACEPLIIDVHREWLMRSRNKLGGRRVRDLLHGGMEWHTALVFGQMLRLQEGGEMVAISSASAAYQSGPLGREEVIVYFDLCRALIAHGFTWCNERFRKSGHWPTKQELPKFRQVLRKFCQNWLVDASEVGSTNKFIIECSRRRVPLAPGVVIEGLEQEATPEKSVSCDCPICQMMHSGEMGVGITMLAGRQLEVDGEFAFSIHETMDAWQRQQRENEQLRLKIEQTSAERAAKDAADSGDDELESVWKSSVVQGEIPGDSRGHISLAFRLAEIVSQLQSLSAPKPLIREINQRFRAYRRSATLDLNMERQFLFSSLEVTADQFPPIRDQVADFQSLVLEYERRTQPDEFDRFPR